MDEEDGLSPHTPDFSNESESRVSCTKTISEAHSHCCSLLYYVYLGSERYRHATRHGPPRSSTGDQGLSWIWYHEGLPKIWKRVFTDDQSESEVIVKSVSSAERPIQISLHRHLVWRQG